jgi:hypothetical protein
MIVYVPFQNFESSLWVAIFTKIFLRMSILNIAGRYANCLYNFQNVIHYNFLVNSYVCENLYLTLRQERACNDSVKRMFKTSVMKENI